MTSDAPESPIEKEADVTAHKQAISRHRHKWAPASTPPGYWYVTQDIITRIIRLTYSTRNIGFPDTQQVADINRQAVELHGQKRNAVEQEAG